MTEKEIVACIRAYYPYYYKGITSEEAQAVVDVWKIQFGNYDYELVKRGIDNWASRKTTPPTVAEIKYSLTDYYSEYDRIYAQLVRENADPKEIERIENIRSAIWECMHIKLK